MEGVKCNQSTEPIFLEGVTCTSQSFDVVMFKLYLAYFVSPGYFCFLYCAHKIELIITRKTFTELCCT